MLIRCPQCKDPICKGFEEVIKAEIDFSFSMRCGHCLKDVTVIVRFETNPEPLEIVRVVKQANIVVAQKNIHLDAEAGSGPRVRVL